MVCRAGNDRRRRAVRGLGRALADAAAGRTGRPDRRDLGRDAPARLSPGLRPRPGPGRPGPGSAGRRPGDQRLPSPRAPGETDRPGPVHPDGLAVPGRGRRGAGDPDPPGDPPVPAAVWAILKSRPEGFPWLSVAGRELTGITVIDLDASVVQVAS